ncbi:MAG: glycosyltransferase [Fulvimarina manganoxydans]|uniref:glycosyltransferase n=1 Tax=Fulvimarina manganoxydans TaxID=937218 RepID=UPI002357272E|nr:glycosyltransferase [Fulvimarina manganoxydans]MCK5930943.1 glycosyltransferase [Fulvimarina manganoxydans]
MSVGVERAAAGRPQRPCRFERSDREKTVSFGERVAGHGGDLVAVRHHLPAPRLVRYVACIPVRNEADRIDRCLSSLWDEFGPQAHILLLVNDSCDETEAIVSSRIAAGDLSATLVVMRWRDGLGTAPRARALAFELAGQIASEARLFSTDGDTIVCRGLMKAYDDAFDQGFDLVCGRIGFIPEEALWLTPVDPRRDAAIRAYRDASREIASLIFPDSDNPWPHHGNIGGANFAITADAYRQAGPIPRVPFGEDRALRRRCEAHGLRILYADGPRVETSCRLDRSATGGLAAELLRNRTEPDPVVDEALEAPIRLLRRLRLRHLVEREEDRSRLVVLLVRGGMTPDRAQDIADLSNRRMAWFHVEEELASLRRERLAFSAMERSLPGLLRLRDKIAGAPRGSLPFREG